MGHDRVDLEDICPVLNPVRAADLVTILQMTPESLRIDLALLWTGLTQHLWATLAGVQAPRAGATNVLVSRWCRGEVRVPLAAALRLSAVVGVPAPLLFAEVIRLSDHRDSQKWHATRVPQRAAA